MGSPRFCHDLVTEQCKKMKLDLSFTLYAKINLKQTINLNIRAKTVKVLEDICIILCDLVLGKDFFRCDTKSMIHKTTKCINWTNLESKTFVVQKIPLRR